MKYCAHCGKEHCDEAVICTGCGVSFEPAKKRPMKWYKFLIYFSIILGAVLNALLGVLYLTGWTYPLTNNISADFIYSLYGKGYRIMDMVYGVVLIAIAILGFVTRHRLAKFKKNGPATLYALYISSTLVSLIYTVLSSAFAAAVSDGTVFMIGYAIGQVIGQIAGTALVVFLNYIYFKKRRDLFCN
jgi:hypothetical protein